MNSYRFFVFAAILLCVLGVQTAAAQPQPWNVTVIQGNGQLICNFCNSNPITQGVNSTNLAAFDPLYVKVTDANGNPVANTSVQWNVTNGGQYVLIPASTTTTTDATGQTHILFVAPQTSLSQNGAFQTTVTASPVSASGNSANFTLTQTSVNAIGSTQVTVDFFNNPQGTAPPVGTTISGSAGTSGTPITIGVFGAGTSFFGGATGITGPIGGVSVKLVNFETTPKASVTCATQSGADPGSVLTDATSGYATCTPIFAGSGTVQFGIMVGGIVVTTATYSDGAPVPAAPPYISNPAATTPDQPQPTYAGYSTWLPVNASVVPAVLNTIQFVSGNNQTANSGQSLAAPLVASLTSTTGTPIVGQAVTWTVSPAGSAVLTNTSNSSDVNGQVSTNVSFTNSANGQVSITVAATGTGKTLTFTANAIIPTQISGLTKASGDGQTALVNTAFASPLVVQVSVSSGSLSGQTVNFSASGPATLSASSAITDSNGRAQVNVQAGSAAGAVTVTASVGNVTPVTFNLTVAPPGPQLTANSFFNGADFQKGSISPCGIATAIAPGLAPNVSGVVASYNIVGYLNYTVAGDTVTVAGAQAPIYNVANVNGQQQVTFQVPCSVTPGASVPVTITVGGGSATVNTAVLPASPGVFQTSNNVTVPNFGSVPIAVIMKRDGTLVSPSNPARINETVIAFVTGMGPTTPSVATNSLPIFGTAAAVTGQVVVGIQNAGVPVTFAQLSEDLIGVYLVAFQIPVGTPTGNDVFSIGVVPTGSSTPYYSNPAAIYIQ